MKKTLSKNLGKRIKEFKKSKHIRNEEFCEKIGISTTFLWDLENGNKNPSLETLVKNCKCVGMRCRQFAV